MVEKLSEVSANVATELDIPVLNEATRNAPQSHASVVSSSGEAEVDLATLRVHDRGFKAKSEGLLARRVWNLKN